MLEAIILIHNFCTDYVGYNQIRTVFDPEYARIQNLAGYDRIAQYYFCPGDYDSEEDEGNLSDESENNGDEL